MTQAKLLDIAGTVAPMEFFVGESEAYFVENGPAYLKIAPANALEIMQRLQENHNLKTREEVVTFLSERLRARDFSDPDFMALRGFVTNAGYDSGDLVTPIYDDVPPALDRWQNLGIGVHTFSQGSESNQRQIFRNTTHGNLSHLVDRLFDTNTVGSKFEADSYRAIADAIRVGPEAITFLSDRVTELDAASKAGYDVVLVVRPGDQPGDHSYRAVETFDGE